MNNFIIFHAVLFIALSVQPSATKTAAVEVPSCGIASAYGMIVHSGGNVVLDDVTKRYQSLYPGEDVQQMPLSHLVELIRSFGFHAVAAQTKISSMDKTNLPAILCIVTTPSGQPLPLGHVLLLRHIDGDVASIIDYQSGYEASNVSLEHLQKISNGKIIFVAKNSPSGSSLWMRVAWLSVILMVLTGLVVALLPQEWEKSIFLVLFSIFLFVGCEEKNGADSDISSVTRNKTSVERNIFTPVDTTKYHRQSVSGGKFVVEQTMPRDSLLFFENCIKDYGVFRCGDDPYKIGYGGCRIAFDFPFTVGSQEVVIEKIDTSCGCVESATSLVGQKLPAGTSQNIQLIMDVRTRSGPYWAQAIVHTIPQAEKLILLQMDVFVTHLPKVEPREPIFRSEPSKHLTNALITVNYLRDTESPPIAISTEKSNFGDFRLVDSKLKSTRSIYEPREFQDQLSLILESQRVFASGTHEKMITLAWVEELPNLDIPIKVLVEPAIKLPISRLFVGEVEPNEEKIMSVRISTYDTSRQLSLTQSVNDDTINVSLNEKEKKLDFRIKAPQKQGRFEKVVSITFQGEEHTIMLPVTGVVRSVECVH